MSLYRIIDTDNFGGDYPDEHFHLWPMGKESADKICELLNQIFSGDSAPRYYRVVPNDYVLAPSFEP